MPPLNQQVPGFLAVASIMVSVLAVLWLMGPAA